MITLKKSNNIFYNKKVILHYFFTDEFDSDNQLNSAIDWFEMRITGSDNEEVFHGFLENFISDLKNDFFIDFISYERSAQLKNRIRTYAKCYHDLRKEHLINEKYMVEKEIDTNENYSIFSGILQVDEVDNEIIFEKLLDNYNQIIHAEVKGEDQEKPHRLEDMLDNIDLELLRNNKLVEVNYPILLERFLKKNSVIISYMYDGGDDLIFTAYSDKSVSNQLEKLIVNSIPEDQKVNRIIATSDEVDKLVESYFNDWRKVKN